MSKLGKRFRLSSDGTIITKQLLDAVTNASASYNIEEVYSQQNNIYKGYITFDTSDKKKLNSLKDAFATYNNTQIVDINFDVDTHYEELVELNKQKNKSLSGSVANLVDSLNIYKYKSPLEYNFLVKNYENYLKNSPNVQETALPNFYEVINEFIKTDNVEGLGTSFFETPQSIITTNFRNDLKTNIIPSNIQINKKAFKLSNYLQKFNIYKEQFPFYTDISFDSFSLSRDSLTNAFNEKNLFDDILNNVINSNTNTSLYFIESNIFTQSIPIFQIKSIFNNAAGDTAQNKENRQLSGGSTQKATSKLPLIGTNRTNFSVILKPLQQPNFKVVNSFINKIIVKESNLDDFLNSQLNNFIQTDFTFIFELNQKVHNKSRDFVDILTGQPEYSEIIGYHLKKFEGTTSVLVQEWFIPNINSEKISLVDTQIKYDKEYTYKLDPVIITFATDYRITSQRIDETGRLVVGFENKPVIKSFIIQNIQGTPNKTLGPSYTNSLLDYPPLEPEVEFIPYISVDNKIKINLNTSTGLKTVPAVNFDPSEEILKDKLRAAQNKDIKSPLLTFQTDEPADFMEIYRVEDVKPNNYDVFFNNLLASIGTNNSSAASLEDNIKPNKKYYYVARCKDYHGNISNPTPVYEVELISDNGLVIPNIQIVQFDNQENNKQDSKEFKRYIKIQPAIRHRLVNYQKTNTSNIELGTDPVTPWNQRFKLRLISKSTGKKIDINFTFKYNKP